MAFQRPFRWFDQIDNIKDELLKWISTTIKTLDGIDAYIPMPLFLKIILRILQLMNSWEVSLSSISHDEKIDQAFLLINSFLEENEFVLKFPSHKTIVEKLKMM
jgi:p-aminobenzoyl-glutamate transporter AbgT